MKRQHVLAYTVMVALLVVILPLIFLTSGHPVTVDGTSQCPVVSSDQPGNPFAAPQALSWIIGARPIEQLEQAGASQHLINAAFNNNHTYVYGPMASDIGVPTADYTSYASIKAAFKDGRLPGGYRAVIYDNERWQLTPVTEQAHPQRYERLVAKLLHQHGLIYIATPAPDLTWATGNPGEGSYLAYLHRYIAGTAARYANVIDIQAQIRETNLSNFTSFVTAAVQQARAFNPRIRVLIGLRANPIPYSGITAIQKLSAAYHAVATLGDGYWLNVNGHPQPAVCLLQEIYA